MICICRVLSAATAAAVGVILLGGCGSTTAGSSSSTAISALPSTASTETSGAANSAGNSSLSDSSASSKNACDVATLDVVKAALGDSAAPGEPAQQMGRLSICHYTVPSSAAYSGSSSVNVQVAPWSDFASMKNPVDTSVDGLGDEAFFKGALSVLYVRKGSMGVSVQITGTGSKDAALAAEKQLASRALTNL